ncbi:hypothetical protein [Streptomyces sp. CB02115]|uniref:hypothetical protein n=1 Tax=Streptomyces sp. CB02115 TaxID=1703939 RepID=UPI000A59DA26|nr:hypothetical protein [Streptomyces sp. CB02115]
MTPRLSATDSQQSTRLAGWLTTVTGLAAIVAVVVLALAGHETAAAVAGAIGGGASATGTIRVTVRIRR